MLERLDRLLQLLLLGPGGTPSQGADPNTALAWFLFLVQWSAILLSALTGLYAARRNGLGFFGSLVIAFVSCVGGGTVRDLLLGRIPVFWLQQAIYPVTVLLVSTIAALVIGEAEQGDELAGRITQPVERLVAHRSRTVIMLDALALGLWAYLGAFYALEEGVAPVTAPIMGVIGGSFGGVLRDVFFARIPQQFRPGQLYVLGAAAGASAFVVLESLGYQALGFTACLALTFVVRMLTIRYTLLWPRRAAPEAQGS